SRRDFLNIGALGMGGLSLPGLYEAKASGLPITGKSVVLLFLQGGPPHIETFDPKMSAPAEYRSITGEIKTKLPGVTFGSTFPKMAAMADQLAVVRSFGSKNGNHTYQSVSTGGNEMKAAMGAIYNRVAGPVHGKSGLPNNILVLPEAVKSGLKLGSNFETSALPTLTQPGDLGASMGAFNPSGGGHLKTDMEIRLSPERMRDRKSLLQRLDGIQRAVDAGGAMESVDRYRQQAFDVITRGIGSAFDLANEDPKTIAKYDTTHLFDARELQKWNDMKRATNLLGHQMLLARRLCEAGCGFVTVSDCGWDYHANNNSPKNMAGIHPMGHQVDHAVAAFLEDVRERGLSNDILLIITSEMGRSPKINKNGGRDHYGNLTPLVFAGGGLKMGQVIGASDATAANPATRPYDPTHLLSTIFHTLFDVGELRVTQGIPDKIIKMADTTEPIAELF
ncbi:MAG: DUF1501 domain-containing protein, partial [Verrucomicrobiota bacterium]